MTIQELFEKFGKAFMAGDLEKIAECLTPDFEWRQPDGEVYSGKDNALQAMKERFANREGPRFADSKFEFFGDTVVQTYRVTATSANGETREVAGTDVYRIEGGLIALKDAYWKQLVV